MGIMRKILFDPQLGFVLMFRLYCKNIPKVIKLFLRKRMFRKYGVLIGENTIIGKNVKFVHPTSVVIGEGVEIGDNVLIYQNVTIGKNNTLEKSIKDGYPTIKDNVIIYANSIIVGDITIERDVVVGANSFVNKSVEPNAVVFGSPAKKYSKR